MQDFTPERRAIGRFAPWIVIALPLAILLVNAATFLPHQALWFDEIVQLGGIGLGPKILLPWLAGRRPDLGVAADRMPPGSYLLQIAWGVLAGNTELTMRWFSLLCALVGTGFTAAAARRAFGAPAALVAGLFLALGP